METSFLGYSTEDGLLPMWPHGWCTQLLTPGEPIRCNCPKKKNEFKLCI